MPKSNTYLRPGQFWAIPLADGLGYNAYQANSKERVKAGELHTPTQYKNQRMRVARKYEEFLVELGKRVKAGQVSGQEAASAKALGGSGCRVGESDRIPTAGARLPQESPLTVPARRFSPLVGARRT